MNAVDTNVLVYAHDPRDPVKRDTALALIGSLTDGVLLWQVAVEYLAACRKLEPHGYSLREGWQDVRDLRQVWRTLRPSWQVLDRAESVMSQFSLSFWDAMVIAACLEGGVTRLYTEDFGAYSRIEALEVVNPFGTT